METHYKYSHNRHRFRISRYPDIFHHRSQHVSPPFHSCHVHMQSSQIDEGGEERGRELLSISSLHSYCNKRIAAELVLVLSLIVELQLPHHHNLPRWFRANATAPSLAYNSEALLVVRCSSIDWDWAHGVIVLRGDPTFHLNLSTLLAQFASSTPGFPILIIIAQIELLVRKREREKTLRRLFGSDKVVDLW